MGDSTLARLLGDRGIRDARVLYAIASLDRRHFVPGVSETEAVEDSAMPIGFGQTISQPFVVAVMSAALQLEGGERVLEIGTGSGYQCAVLSALCREVYSIEIIAELADRSRAALEALGRDNIHLRCGDGALGWPEAAPFDAIVLTAAPLHVPAALVEQLRPGGRLVAPVGAQQETQELVLMQKRHDGELTLKNLLPVRFVPMTGIALDR